MRRRGYLILAAAAGVLCLLGLITLARSQNQERAPDPQHGALIAAQGTACGANYNTFTLREWWQRDYRENSHYQMGVVAQKLNDQDIPARSIAAEGSRGRT
jgi:hypothetical protein